MDMPTNMLPPLGLDAPSLGADFQRYFHYTLGRDNYKSSRRYLFLALAYALRDRLMARGNDTRHAYERSDTRRTCYLSMEYLIGRTLGNAMLNLGVTEAANEALEDLGLTLETIVEQEHDAGLGNGGLGRLAACFLDSAATLGLPVIGYGLRYHFGMFRQRIDNGYQVEEPDPWLRDGHPWEIPRPEYTQRVQFGGRTHFEPDPSGRPRARWVDTDDVLTLPYDVPIPGYRNGTVNTLRLWSAIATDELDLAEFNAGSYPEAVEAKNAAEHITMVLYPNDASENGKELRLKQQYLLASASLQDTLRQWMHRHGENFDRFACMHCFQLNDTHPSIAIAELMRLLVDVHGLDWDEAWNITSRTMAYTNHTLLPEALERWPVRVLRRLLPRPMEIIEEVNARFVAEVARRWPGDTERQRRMSIIEQGNEPMVRMAYLAIVASFSVNGVAALHSSLLQRGLFADFYALWPERFNNKTNGVTPRRWLAGCNPRLSTVISQTIGEGWRQDFDQVARLGEHAADPDLIARWQDARRANKARLAALVQRECGVEFPTDALFDVQVKRIHEYKRQLLNVLHVIHLYCRIKRGDVAEWTPRCVLIGGKAAPGYAAAKRIIKLINSVFDVVNGDPSIGARLKTAFLPDYRVSSMEIICAGADLSAQISTAGKEASGTGNMKLMMNGALTIGTHDGANIEILEAVGEENFFAFGLGAAEVQALRRDYRPHEFIEADERLGEVVDLIASGHFDRGEPNVLGPVLDAIRSPHDPWMTAADFSSFVDAQQRAARAFRDQDRWTRMSILNTAASARFSSDRTVAEYNSDIWKLAPITARDGPG